MKSRREIHNSTYWIIKPFQNINPGLGWQEGCFKEQLCKPVDRESKNIRPKKCSCIHEWNHTSRVLGLETGFNMLNELTLTLCDSILRIEKTSFSCANASTVQANNHYFNQPSSVHTKELEKRKKIIHIYTYGKHTYLQSKQKDYASKEIKLRFLSQIIEFADK